jgi:hypothetical protein
MKKLLLLFCVVLLFSCEKQDLLETQSEPQQNISVENSTLPELSEITFSKQQSEYKHQSIVETGIEVLEQQYNFQIDTAEVRKVKYRNYTSYTVAIRRPYETANFENLVIMMKNGEEDKWFYIVTYTPTVINIFDPHSSFSFLGERSIQQIFPGDSDSPQMMTTSSDCIGYWETWCSWGGTDHVAGPKCYEANDDRIFKKYVEDENCTETGGPTGGTGGGGSSSGDEPDPVFTSPMYPDGTSAAPAFLINKLSPVTTEQERWIEDFRNDEMVEKILHYVSLNGNSFEAQTFARETSVFIIDFLIENPLSQEAEDLANKIITAGIDQLLVSYSPFFQYPPGTNYASQYPKLTEYLKNKLPNVANIPMITNAIQDITGLSLDEIQEDLEWGKGPIIKILQLDDYADNTNYKTVGAYDETIPEILLLDKDWVNNLENDISDQGLEDAYLFFLGVTVLHEYVHYGDYQNGNNYDYPATAEEGDLFEIQVYGEDVGPTSLIFSKK